MQSLSLLPRLPFAFRFSPYTSRLMPHAFRLTMYIRWLL